MTWYDSNPTADTIVSRVNELASTDDVSFPVWKKAQYANAQLLKLYQIIARVYGGWQYDDANYTDFPVATTAISPSQPDYRLENHNLTIKSAWIKAPDATGYQKLRPMTEEQLNMRLQFNLDAAPSVPTAYYIKGDAIFLYPAPNYADPAGLLIEEDRIPFMISNPSDPSTKISLPNFFYEIIAKGIAVQYLGTRLQPNDRLAQDYFQDLADFEDYFMRRWEDMNPRRIPVADGVMEVL